jgi:N-acetylneuraminate synthase
MNNGVEPVEIGGRLVGPGQPVFVIAEIGINHNGDMELAETLIRVAATAGCDAVKLQKRTPDVCVPDDQKSVQRDTPWGRMTYLDYRHRMEFDADQYAALRDVAEKLGLIFFASPWDVPAVEFLNDLDVPVFKIASASITDHGLLDAVTATGRPVIASTGMTDLAGIDAAVAHLPEARFTLMHTTSTYPCQPDELNLRVIHTLRDRYAVPVGYSGHEVGLQTTVAAVALGASAIERHITLDRTLWGSDQAASVEPGGLNRLVRDIRVVEQALGDGRKRVYDSEIPSMEKLRRFMIPNVARG